MAWLVLFVAGICEVAWAVGLKYADGFTRLGPSVWTVVAMLASFVLLGVAVRSLPIGTSYAVWTGIGTVGTVIFAIARFGEPATPVRLACIALIVLGIIGLRLTER